MMMSSSNRIENLIQGAREGDRQAFSTLEERFRQRMKAIVLHFLGSSHPSVAAEDVLQETFLRAFRLIKHFDWRGEDSLLRWLGGIARNVVYEIARQNRREPLIGLRDDIPRSEPSQSEALRRNERFDRLQSALDVLKAEYREVVLLARIEGLPLKIVAERMHRSREAVRQLLWRALRQLKENFGDTESFSLPQRNLEDREPRNGH